MKLGVLGGTFDPVHTAHLVAAEEVYRQLGLSEVLFVPAGQPWFKANQDIEAAEHRVAMVRLSIAGKSYFRLSTLEVDRPGPSYTVDTIAELRRQGGRGEEIFFILGWDTLAELPLWHEPSRLIRMCRLVAVPRPGYPAPDLNALESRLPGIRDRLVMMDRPEVDISSSGVRERVAQGVPIDDLVPAPVAEYIKKHRLYGAR